MTHELRAFRIVTFLIPPIVSCSLLAVFVWLLHIATEGSPPPMEPSTRTDRIIIFGHILTGMFLSIVLFLCSFRLTLRTLRFPFGAWYNRTFAYFDLLSCPLFRAFYSVRLESSNIAGSLNILFLMYKLPLYVMAATVAGMFLGFGLSMLFKART